MIRHIFSRVLNTPLLIDPAKLQVILGVLSRKAGVEIEGLQQVAEDPFTRRDRRPTGDPRISVIPVYGSLVHRSLGLRPESGMRSYESIRSDFRRALNDPDTVGILFDIDSPGGEVSGLFDLVDEIYQARGTKPIFAVANEVALSAAYAIASAADETYLPRTGWVGSIGVIAVHVDQSAFDAKMGFRYETISAGAREADFSPHGGLNDEARAFLQATVNETYDVFVKAVARNRNLPEEAIRSTDAAIYHGINAVQAGLADGVLTVDQAIQKLIRKGGNMMEIMKIDGHGEDKDTPKAGVEEEIKMETREEGEIRAEARDEGNEQKSNVIDLELVKAGERERAIKILNMGASFRTMLPHGFIEELIKSDVTVDEAGRRILEALAERSDRDSVFSFVDAVSTGESNILIADAMRRARKAQNLDA